VDGNLRRDQVDAYAIGLEFDQETRSSATNQAIEDIDYYEFLQISPKADIPTIRRIYRIMAGRFHPDNPETGDGEKFLILQAAYNVLSDPERRADYDAARGRREASTLPIFEMREFLDGIEGETNRRLGILAMLYTRRKTSPYSPGISLLDLEARMGIPREYLDFTVWYLKNKQHITVADNSEFALTALGVDFVESNASKIPILDRLLQSGPRCATAFRPQTDRGYGASGSPFLMPPEEAARK
jgi:curved DNA-binding protein CbpA